MLVYLPLLEVSVVLLLLVADRLRKGQVVIEPHVAPDLAFLRLVEVFLQLSLLELSDTQQQVFGNAMHWLLDGLPKESRPDRGVSMGVY